MIEKDSLLDELKKRVIEANLPLHEGATNVVMGKGSPDAPILFIGEAPGRNAFRGCRGKEFR